MSASSITALEKKPGKKMNMIKIATDDPEIQPNNWHSARYEPRIKNGTACHGINIVAPR
jgi:hypothetical protein